MRRASPRLIIAPAGFHIFGRSAHGQDARIGAVWEQHSKAGARPHPTGVKKPTRIGDAEG